jgi:cell division protein FtsN
LAPRVSKAFVSGSHRYRLGVGPLPSRAEASKLCSNLIAAGERDCLVRAN